MVLAACAMASGCGQVLRGTSESAFPYANLASLDILEEFGGYVAGVANPRFEELHHTWDVLCDLNTGKVTVSKDLKSAGTGGGKKRESDASLGGSIVQVDGDSAPNTPAVKMSSASRPDCTDNQFMDEVSRILLFPFLLLLLVSSSFFLHSRRLRSYCSRDLLTDRYYQQCLNSKAKPTSASDSQNTLRDSHP
jgi:hypothetical protein